jgi:hypothetical protein
MCLKAALVLIPFSQKLRGKARKTIIKEFISI